jgi:hypothetical protein
MANYDPYFILLTLFSNEQNCLDILPYGFDIINFFKELVHLQKININRFFKKSCMNSLTILLKNLELQRIIFLLKSYHRIRIWKIEKNLIRLKKNDFFKFLSISEKKYCKLYEFFFLKKIGEIFLELFNFNFQRSLRLKCLHLGEKSTVKKNYFIFFKVLKKKNFFEKNILKISNPTVFYGNDIYCMKFVNIKSLVLSRIIFLI